MDTLIEKSFQKVKAVDTRFIRSIMGQIDWDNRLIGIRGARGVGKTTLLLQRIKKSLGNTSESLYVSLDNIWFAEHKLLDMVDLFVKRGGKFLFLDEVHKYPNWSQEIKNIYDDFPDLKVIFTGSSLLEILNARADLSRRAIVYDIQGLSFREYLNVTQKTDFQSFPLSDILTKQKEISDEILEKVKPLQFFGDYLRHGYYPFFTEGIAKYPYRLEEIVNLILEVELPLLRNVEPSYIPKIKQLLQIVAESVPFIPNIKNLAKRIDIHRNTLISYLYYLQETRLTNNLHKDISGINKLQKPDKIYLENTNLAYTLAERNTDIGNMRETFFLNQLSYQHTVEYPNTGDFWVDKKMLFEIGGKSKTDKQLQGESNAYIAADNIEYGFGKKIPLWQFGFLY
ncbi:MAG: AAA family ATPase [Candidatus Symbiothrix sp.]|jgi:predicted AAA+ superfamily ATPase|nr:AAA family ATPase [Candidatus Symbiothrix sp.]